MRADELERRFTHHPPDDERAVRHETVRAEIIGLAQMLCDVVPEGREQSVAMTKLEEVMFWANAGIAREGK